MENTEIKVNLNDIKMQDGMFVYGDYVLAPQKNVFNGLTSWWLSKKLYIINVYTTSTQNGEKIFVEYAAKMFEQYIPYLETIYRKAVA
ncbi:MAG: hypothetical protein IJK26_09970 [Clostridia bacterium]|nr:hypothetical protein [Clostridia bacterium]